MTRKTLARQTVSVIMRGRSPLLRKEYRHVAPRSTFRLDANRYHPLPPLEPAPGCRPGPLELRHGPGSLLWLDGRGHRLGPPPQRLVPDPPRTTPRLVQGRRRQVGDHRRELDVTTC